MTQPAPTDVHLLDVLHNMDRAILINSFWNQLTVASKRDFRLCCKDAGLLGGSLVTTVIARDSDQVAIPFKSLRQAFPLFKKVYADTVDADADGQGRRMFGVFALLHKDSLREVITLTRAFCGLRIFDFSFAMSLAFGLPNLEELILCGNWDYKTEMTAHDKALQLTYFFELLQNGCPKLRALEIDCFHGNFDFEETYEAALEGAALLPTIEKLTIGSCGDLTGEAIATLAQMPRLKSLVLIRMDVDAPQAREQLFSLPSLECLELRKRDIDPDPNHDLNLPCFTYTPGRLEFPPDSQVCIKQLHNLLVAIKSAKPVAQLAIGPLCAEVTLGSTSDAQKARLALAQLCDATNTVALSVIVDGAMSADGSGVGVVLSKAGELITSLCLQNLVSRDMHLVSQLKLSQVPVLVGLEKLTFQDCGHLTAAGLLEVIRFLGGAAKLAVWIVSCPNIDLIGLSCIAMCCTRQLNLWASLSRKDLAFLKERVRAAGRQDMITVNAID